MNTIHLTDILPRRERALDMRPVANLLHGKRVAVTGSGGFIGSELCRQIDGFFPGHLTLIDNCEHGLYQIDRRITAPHSACIADVRDYERMRELLATADVIFHAAALKHVPLCEENKEEAMRTNFGGTENVIAASPATARLVLVSTDKAVRPASHMGYTKHLAEESMRATGRAAIVRFGNVLGSSGSVIPLWMEQIERGGPITVTHPDMERYFMTVGEAVELILQAGAHGAGIYVLDMGEPVKMTDLAQDMIALSGRRDIEIEYTGMRPGERLKEELFYEAEQLIDVGIDGVFMARV